MLVGHFRVKNFKIKEQKRIRQCGQNQSKEKVSRKIPKMQKSLKNLNPYD